MLHSSGVRSLASVTLALGLVAAGLQIAFARTMDAGWVWLQMLVLVVLGPAWLLTMATAVISLRG